VSVLDVETGKARQGFAWKLDSSLGNAPFVVSEDTAIAVLGLKGRLSIYASGGTQPVYESDVSPQPIDWLRLSRDATLLAVGVAGDARVQIRSVPSGTLLSTLQHEGQRFSWPDFSPDGQFVAAAVGGHIVFWRTRGGQELASLAALNWPAGAVVTTPTGYVDFVAAPGSPEPLSCVAGWRVLPFAVCRERWLVPGLLGKVLSGDTSYTLP
jgi:WD40 repeat protein